MRPTLCILSCALFMVHGITGQEQDCEEICTEECKCTDRKTCNENQIDCGESSKPPTGHCDPDRICVAANCLCKYSWVFKQTIIFRPV